MTRAPLDAVWPPFLTVARASEYTGFAKRTITEAIRRGDLPLYGRATGTRRLIVRREDLDRWLAGSPPSTHDSAAREAAEPPVTR